MQGQKNLTNVSQLILSELAPVVGAKHGVFYVMDSNGGGEPLLKLAATYAYKERKHLNKQFHVGEGIVGQAAFEKQRILLQNAPDDYITINSGLGEAKPMQIVVLPIVFEGQVLAVMELATFTAFSDTYLSLLDQLTESIGVVLNTIQANMRTEELLAQSQSLAEELQAQQEELTETNKRLEQQAKSLQASEELLKTQQEELQQTNEELEEKARLLQTQNEEVEHKNREVENAKRQLEEKARQLSLTSKYKSEFLANMSHELRTPLNSLLILAKLLAENPDNNLSGKQVDFAKTIHSSASDLLTLINDILDLSKIESGMMTISLGDLPFTELAESMDKTFRQVANDKRLDFNIELDAEPAAHDSHRRDALAAGAEESARQCVQVHREGRRDAARGDGRRRVDAGPRDAGARVVGDRVQRFRYRHRHPRREAANHLRGVPAGRCQHDAQVRRHGPRPLDQPRNRPPPRRRNSRDERGRHRLVVHALPAAELRGADAAPR